MTAKILDGKTVAAKERQRSAARAADFVSKFGRAPGLAVVKVGDDPASAVYVRNKRKACEECGIASFAHDLPATTTREELLAELRFDASKPVLALLPGSRPNEVRPLLPGLVSAVQLMRTSLPGLQVLIARAPALEDALFAPLEDLRRSGVPVALVDQATDDVLVAADAVVTASGTATVQTALHGRPMVIVRER